MANDTFTMAKYGPTYRNAPRIDFGAQVERIIADAIRKEQDAEDQREQEPEPGQMAFRFDG